MAALKDTAKKIFISALDVVTPSKLVTNALHRCGDILNINGKEYTLKHNVYVVGFGKAVYGMALGLQNVLGEHIINGILSIPHGSENIISKTDMIGNTINEKIKVMQGAQNNLPDEDAIQSAVQIRQLVQSTKTDDILVVLTSGGGSALLPAPVKEISLQQKLTTIKLVANAGGTIQQLNTVRKKLSELKGGKLVSMCPSQNILTLIISDIVKDPLDLIASAPTVLDNSTFQNCLDIFSNLNLNNEIPFSVRDFISRNLKNEKSNKNSENDLLRRCNNVIVGSNKILANETFQKARDLNCLPYIITTELEGDATEIGCTFADLAVALCLKNDEIIKEKILKLAPSADIEALMVNLKHKGKLCFISAGESTVRVTGTGKGGRNQHLVLSAVSRLKQVSKQHRHVNFHQICLLSAGTDGQDGPTDAAGAFCTGDLIDYIIKNDIDVDTYIKNCASYDFFNECGIGNHLLKTGLTGTNVMDVQLLLIDLSCT